MPYLKINKLFFLFLLVSSSLFATPQVYLYVLHSQKGILIPNGRDGAGELIMQEIDESVAFFSYRQDVNATMIPIKNYINFWKIGRSFSVLPPTGLVVAYKEDGELFERATGRFSRPRFNVLEKKLTFEVLWFDTELPNEQIEEVSLLIESHVLLHEN